jgi:SGNH hydrolase-like domain, acetyltransferase AlgX
MNFSIKKFFLCLPLLTLSAVWLQQIKPYAIVYDLAAVKPASPATFSLQNCWDASFQEQCGKYVNDNFGFRPDFVRWQRQVDFSLFNQVTSGDIIVGKNKVLLGGDYVRQYFGTERAGEDKINKLVSNLKLLHDNLAKKGKTLIVVIAADKASFYPELIPLNHVKIKRMTDRQMFELAAVQQKLPYLNFKNYINALKGKTKYPLFPQTGVHWSQYCGSIVLDSITKYIAQKQNIKMPHPKMERVEISATPKDKDGDLAWLSNLKYDIKLNEPLAYPIYAQADTIGKTKPTLLSFGDSYYWTIYDQKLSRQLFKHHTFVYYDQTFYSNDSYKAQIFNTLDLKAAVDRSDVVLFLATSVNLQNLGWGSVEKINEILK